MDAQTAAGRNLFVAGARRVFAPEIESGALRVEHERFYSADAGDADVILAGSHLRLHLQRERRHNRVLVAGTKRPKEWHDLEVALHVVVGLDLPPGLPFLDLESLDHSASLVRTHFAALTVAFQQPWWRWIGTRKRLERSRNKAIRDFLEAPKIGAEREELEEDPSLKKDSDYGRGK